MARAAWHEEAAWGPTQPQAQAPRPALYHRAERDHCTRGQVFLRQGGHQPLWLPVSCSPPPPGSPPGPGPLPLHKALLLGIKPPVPSFPCFTAEGREDTRPGWNSQGPRPGLSSGSQGRKRGSRPGEKRAVRASGSQAGHQAAGPGCPFWPLGPAKPAVGPPNPESSGRMPPRAPVLTAGSQQTTVPTLPTRATPDHPPSCPETY